MTPDQAAKAPAEALQQSLGRAAEEVAALTFDPGLDVPGFHELRITLTDAGSGAIVAEAGRPFYWSGTEGGARPEMLTILIALTLCCLVLAFLLLRSRKKTAAPRAAPPEAEPAAAEPQAPPAMRELRESMRKLREQAEGLERGVLEYGNPLEQKAQRWRSACHDTARRAVAAMKSCWLMREDNPETGVIYNELLANLGAVGLSEIAPRAGETVDNGDLRYLLCEKRGAPPYKVVKVLTPGFLFSPRMPWPKEPADEVILAPAELEVEGTAAATSAR
jgi:hypothetical protein